MEVLIKKDLLLNMGIPYFTCNSEVTRTPIIIKRTEKKDVYIIDNFLCDFNKNDIFIKTVGDTSGRAFILRKDGYIYLWDFTEEELNDSQVWKLGRLL